MQANLTTFENIFLTFQCGISLSHVCRAVLLFVLMQRMNAFGSANKRHLFFARVIAV